MSAAAMPPSRQGVKGDGRSAYGSFQEKRRLKALEKQRGARHDRAQLARRLVHASSAAAATVRALFFVLRRVLAFIRYRYTSHYLLQHQQRRPRTALTPAAAASATPRR